MSDEVIQIWEIKPDKVFYVAKAEVGGKVKLYESSYNSDFDRNGEDAKKARMEIRDMILKDNPSALLEWPWLYGLAAKPKEMF
ncbi:MAG: hypothetical protein WA139_03570 [Candidatus Aenigmatarchaeota archaeon]